MLESRRHTELGLPQEPSQLQGQPELGNFFFEIGSVKDWRFMQNQSTVEVINDVFISQTVAGI